MKHLSFYTKKYLGVIFNETANRLLVSFQGIRHVDHFGFICRETVEGGSCHFVCYVFQCTDESLVRDG